ncbi:hypothetical protein Pd630_LPD04262 [Rhodococcus opacus PD630]|nr:hypothetical protein Pd630_LPD04262 [Rhodococcus opacus PD630]
MKRVPCSPRTRRGQERRQGPDGSHAASHYEVLDPEGLGEGIGEHVLPRSG